MIIASPAGRFERIAFGLLLALIAVTMVNTQWLWRWDQLIYDTQLKWWSRAASQEIVIVAIDEFSLSQLGRWPWKREVHAQLLDRLSLAGAKAIGLDIIFTEADTRSPESDAALARALRKNGRTVLPVFVEPPQLGGQLVERLPIPIFSDASRSLGHVHVELDRDGIARSVFLKEGLGEPVWPTLALALLGVGSEAPISLPGLRNPTPPASLTRAWVRDFLALIPFAGPSGRFTRVSYQQVIAGTVDLSLFKDKYVLVGMTAAGAGDALPTPVSGQDQFMPGVEFNANVLDVLINDIVVQPIALRWQYIISALVALLPAILYPRVPPRLSLVSAASLLLLSVLVCLLLLRVAKLWFAPMPALLSVALSYPLWSWWRLAATMRFLDQELAALRREQAELNIAPRQPIHASVRFLARVMGLRGWIVRDRKSEESIGLGIDTRKPTPISPQNQWTEVDDTLWTQHREKGTDYDIGLQLKSKDDRDVYANLLQWFVRPEQEPASATPVHGEIMQKRIDQVRIATQDLRAVRQLVNDSIAQMTTGFVVTSRMGRVTVANPPGAKLLTGHQTSILGRSIIDLLESLEVQDAIDPVTAIRHALIDNQHVSFNARNENGQTLFVQLGPLALETQRGSGLILNVSDVSALHESERRRAEVLGFVSHDIRSPLVSILALVELSESRQSVEELRALLRRTESYAGKTLQLAEQLLELARAESLEPSDLQECDLVASAIAAYEQTWSQAQTKSMNLQIECELEEAWIPGDPDLIERALVNLLTNAIKYSPEARTIVLRVTQSNSVYRFDVQDQGYGIAAEDIDRLFERFQRGRGRQSREQRGVGLGLAFVQAVTQKHGGKIEVVSQPGIGSTFSIILPKP